MTVATKLCVSRHNSLWFVLIGHNPGAFETDWLTMPVVSLEDHAAVADVFPLRELQGAGFDHKLHFAHFGGGAAGEAISLFSQIFLINPG